MKLWSVQNLSPAASLSYHDRLATLSGDENSSVATKMFVLQSVEAFILLFDGFVLTRLFILLCVRELFILFFKFSKYSSRFLR